MLIIGVINLIIGFFRLSIIVSFTSLSIIKGFTSASALIIMSTQLPSLLGVNIKHSQFFVPTIYNTIIALPDAHLPTLILGISSLAIIVLVRKISTIPSGLIALIIATIFTGIVLSFIFNDQDYGTYILIPVGVGLFLSTLVLIPFSKIEEPLKAMKKDQILEVWGTDEGSKKDIPGFVEKRKHQLLSLEDLADGYTKYLIKI